MKKNKAIYLIAYKNSANIGDNFQTLSTKNVLEKLGYEVKYIDRDGKDTDEEKIIFINGYYSPKTIKNLNFNFSDKSKVIFFNIHLASDNGRINYLKSEFLKNKNIYNTLKKYEPIGCRDQATADILNSFNIRAENNECITLLFDKRTKEQGKNANKIILVDVDEFVPIPKNTNLEIEYKSQMIEGGENLTNQEKLKLSEEILDYYKNNAKLIITSRFHCAMPCIAMGIPVVFFGNKDSNRCAGLKKYINYYDYINLGKRATNHLKKISWSDSIPLLNKKIKYDFNIIDIIYNIFYKIYLNFLYKFGFIKINWDSKIPDIEKHKIKMKNKIKMKIEN